MIELLYYFYWVLYYLFILLNFHGLANKIRATLVIKQLGLLFKGLFEWLTFINNLFLFNLLYSLNIL